MESISPTLALAVLLFGISGNTNEATQEASIDTSGSGCPDVTIAEELAQPPVPETWTEAFLDVAGSTAALPDLIEPKWSDSAPSAIESADPIAVSSADPVDGSDPITRDNVPASLSALDVDPGVDPCGPRR